MFPSNTHREREKERERAKETKSEREGEKESEWGKKTKEEEHTHDDYEKLVLKYSISSVPQNGIANSLFSLLTMALFMGVLYMPSVGG